MAKAVLRKSTKVKQSKPSPKKILKKDPKPTVSKKALSVTPIKRKEVTKSEETRVPVRKVIELPLSRKATTPSNAQTVPKAPTSAPQTAAKVVPIHQKMGWSALPSSIPPHIKFLMQSADRECQSASECPFSFAKFIASLPKEMCGFEFALLLLSLEHSDESISKLCKLDLEKVRTTLSHGQDKLREQFSEKCGELERKWFASQRGTGRTVESLVEPYLLPKLDRNLQLLVSSVILRGL